MSMNFDATNVDLETVQCVVCEKEITNGKWTARVKHGDRMVAVCCPLCLEAFETNPDLYARRLDLLKFSWSRERSSNGVDMATDQPALGRVK